MGVIYTISSNKGGTGKSSLVSNISSVIAENQGKKILIIDTDGQGNLSIAFGLNPSDYENTTYDVLVKGTDIKDCLVKVTDNIDLLPSNDDMNILEFDILPKYQEYKRPFHLLYDKLSQIKNEYDYIFIDTPPSLGLVAGNVLVASDKVIIPFVPEMYSVRGLVKVINAVNDFKRRDNPNLEIAGVVGVMVDSRTNLHTDMLQQARRYCLENDIKMFDTIIPKSIRFANATAYQGKPAVLTESSHPMVKSYFKLTDEIV